MDSDYEGKRFVLVVNSSRGDKTSYGVSTS